MDMRNQPATAKHGMLPRIKNNPSSKGQMQGNDRLAVPAQLAPTAAHRARGRPKEGKTNRQADRQT
eukprot:3775117-Alexandrium_andersonii.AAC.1